MQTEITNHKSAVLSRIVKRNRCIVPTRVIVPVELDEFDLFLARHQARDGKVKKPARFTQQELETMVQNDEFDCWDEW